MMRHSPRVARSMVLQAPTATETRYKRQRRYAPVAGYIGPAPSIEHAFLAYADIDGTYSYDPTKNFLKTWTPHVQDWREGDPTWQDGKGKGIVGAINYLAAQGLNTADSAQQRSRDDRRGCLGSAGRHGPPRRRDQAPHIPSREPGAPARPCLAPVFARRHPVATARATAQVGRRRP